MHKTHKKRNNTTMDKTTKYEAMILDMIDHMEGIKISNEPKLETKLIIDKEKRRYMVVTVGWNEAGDYHHSCSVHVEIINEKLWFYTNMTDIDFGRKLVYQGVPPSDIVVGFLTPKMREVSDYAVA